MVSYQLKIFVKNIFEEVQGHFIPSKIFKDLLRLKNGEVAFVVTQLETYLQDPTISIPVRSRVCLQEILLKLNSLEDNLRQINHAIQYRMISVLAWLWHVYRVLPSLQHQQITRAIEITMTYLESDNAIVPRDVLKMIYSTAQCFVPSQVTTSIKGYWDKSEEIQDELQKYEDQYRYESWILIMREEEARQDQEAYIFKMAEKAETLRIEQAQQAYEAETLRIEQAQQAYEAETLRIEQAHRDETERQLQELYAAWKMQEANARAIAAEQVAAEKKAQVIAREKKDAEWHVVVPKKCSKKV